MNLFITTQNQPIIHLFTPYLDCKISPNVKDSSRIFIGWNFPDNYEIFEYRKKHSLPCVWVERGALPGSIFFDVNGFNCNSTSYQEEHWNRELSEQQRKDLKIKCLSYKKQNSPNIDLEQQKSTVVDKSAFENKIDFSPYEKVVFVPLQLSTDSVIRDFAGFAESVENFTKIISDLAKKHQDILFLYKNHPVEIPLKHVHKETNNLINVDHYHFKACLDACDAVICINSGVGLQAMIYEKPVLLLGDAFYHFKGINHAIKSYEEISPLLNSKLTVDRERIQRFLYWLWFEFYSNVVWRSYSNRNISRILNIDSFQIWTKDRIYKYK